MNRVIAATLIILTGAGGPINTAFAAPPLNYGQCVTLELDDSMCHRRIIEAGGESASVPQTANDVAQAVDHTGRTQQDIWYKNYVNYARDYGAVVESRRVALLYYPRYPPVRPFGFR